MTVSNYNLVGTYELNKWIWSKLQTFDWKTGERAFKDYTGAGGTVNLIPMIQGGQVPDFTNLAGGPPFIVFNYSTGGGIHWECTYEQTAYLIWDSNSARLRAVQNYMADLLKRFEWTAAEVNDFLGTTTPFDFKYTNVTTVTSPDPALTEMGRQKGLVVVAHEYTRDMDQRGMRV